MEDEEFHDCTEGPHGPNHEEDKDDSEELKNHVFTKLNELTIEEERTESEQNDEAHLSTLLEKAPLNQQTIIPNKEVWGDEEGENPFQIEKNIDKALEEKEEGNKFFRLKDYDQSIQHYSNAIAHCPETSEYAEQLATFYGNRSAAYFAEEEHELVIEDCTEALKLKEDYSKVLARRMQSYDKLDKYEEALTDAKKLKELDPSYPKIDIIIARLQRLYDEKMAKMKDEALGKLKELGNTILGNFGMSLDNFKMVQDPNTGSWSISMNN